MDQNTEPGSGFYTCQTSAWMPSKYNGATVVFTMCKKLGYPYMEGDRDLILEKNTTLQWLEDFK